MKKVLGIVLALVLVCCLFTAAAEGKTLKVAYITNSMSNEMNAYGFKIALQRYTLASQRYTIAPS